MENKREKTIKLREAEKPGVLLRQGRRWRQKIIFFGRLMVVVKRHSRTQCSALCLPRGTAMINKNHVRPENVTEIPWKKVNKTIALFKQKLNQFPVSLYYSVTYSFCFHFMTAISRPWTDMQNKPVLLYRLTSTIFPELECQSSLADANGQFEPSVVRHINSTITQG